MPLLFTQGAGLVPGRFRPLTETLAALLMLTVFAALALGSAGALAPPAARVPAFIKGWHSALRLSARFMRRFVIGSRE
jgi:hypothetical protein